VVASVIGMQTKFWPSYACGHAYPKKPT
jgi:hypothetical protein